MELIVIKIQKYFDIVQGRDSPNYVVNLQGFIEIINHSVCTTETLHLS